MSMYKKIFWSEEYKDYSSGAEVASISGEVLIFGQSAFASLDEAVAAAGAENAIVIKVASGKYDSFTVVTNGVRSAASPEVVAVNFGGGTVENVTVDPVDAPADLQAAIIDNLNNIHAAEGKIFVAAENVSESSSTLFIGAADTVSNVTAANGDAALFINEEYVQNIGNTVEIIASGAELYVSNSYNDKTEGYGTTKFSNYAAAYAYAKANNTKATIVVEGTNTLSGNCFDNNHKNYSGITVVVKDGASVGNSLSKWDMTHKVTVEAGGKIEMARPASGSVSNIHIKSALTIGEAGEGKKTAYLDLLSDSYQDGDISIRYNGSIVANNAEIEVQDLDAQGKLSLTDTKVTVDGAFASATFFATTLTRTEMTVGGTQISGGLSDFAGGTANQLGNVTMTDSSIEFKTGDVKVAANMKMSGNSSLTAKNLIINSGKTLTMDSTSTLTLDSLAGDGKININLLDGFKLGDKVVDFTGNNATEDMLSKITFSGANGYEAEIVDGDIVIGKASVKVDDGMLDLSQNDAFTKEGAILGTATDDLSITTGAKDSTDVTETAEIKSEVVGKDITLENSKNLAVTGAIEATGTATLTNKGDNKFDAEGNLVAEAVLNGGYDENGNEKTAKIEAEKIVLQNDGHANVELTAKDINIANNSNETLTGTIGNADTNSVVIAAGTATADGVDIDGTLDGTIEKATITAKNISIANQAVTDTALKGNTVINGNTSFNGETSGSGIVVKVVNGAVLDINDTYTGANLAAGDDAYFGFGDGSANKGGTINLNGEVRVNQINADDGGVVNIAAGANVYSGEVCVENGNIADATSGVLSVDGTLNTASLRVFNGGTVNVSGTVNADHTDYPIGTTGYTVIDVWGEGSSLNIDDGTVNVKDDMKIQSGAALNINGGTLNVDYTLTNNGTFAVSGDSELNIGTLTGAAAIVADAKLTDSNVGGKVSVGFDAENAADTTLTLAGDTDITTLYVGKEGRENAYKAVISGADTDVAIGSIYNRTDSTLEITDGAHLEVSNYWQSKGDVVIDGASAELTGVNMYVYNNDSTDAATITLRNGASLSTKANYAIYLGNSEGGPAKGNASMTLESGSSLNVKNLTLHADGEVEEVAGAAAQTSVSVTDSTLNVSGTLTNNGTVTVAGESTLNIANMTGDNIQAADGAIIKDSTIGGGGITATGDLTFKGDNKLGGFSMGFFGHNVTIGADASLETTGTGRVSLAYANTLDVDGSITDAKTADKATTKKSLNVAGGVSITGEASYGAENNGATLDVDNAYISLGSTTSKNTKATGDFVLDFNNSIVEFTKDFQIAASKGDGLTPTYQLNVTDSVMTVADRFAFNHENGTAVIDNSTLDITNQFKNVGNFTLQNGSEMSVGGNADGPSYEKTGNFGTLNVKSGSTFAMADTAASAAYPFYNAGTVNVDGATFNVANVKNTDTANFTVSGESTLKIANLSGNADITDAELQDGSYITNGDGTIYFNGSNAIDGAVTIGSEIYNYGKLDVKDGATFTNQSGEITYLVGTGASLNVAENATIKVNDLWNNVQGSAVSTIDGTAEISHNAWLRNATINGSLSVENQLAVYSNDAFNVNGELTINGNGSPAGWLIGNPGSSTGAYAGNITVNVTGGTVNVTGTSTGEEIIIQQYGILNINPDAQGKVGTVSVNGIITNKGEVNITDGSMTSNYKITNSGAMNVTDGVVTASSITNTGTISLTVTADKLATVGNDAYYIINQTGTGAALNNNVTIDGVEYSIGQSVTVGDIVYTVTNGDGNDIAIQAQATVFFVDASYDENTAGYGFNKFSSFDDAVKALKNNDTVIKLFSDAEMSETTDPSFKLNVVSGDGSKHTLKINDAQIDVDANFAKEVDIDTDLFMAYYNNHNVVVNGDLKGGIYNYGGTLTLNNSKITNSWDNSNIFGVVNINGDGTWTLDNAQADNLKFIGIGRNSGLNQGILNLNDTVVKAIQYTVDSQSANTKSQINAVNSTIGTVLNDGGWGHLVVTANGEVNLTNSNLSILGTLTNDGAINVTGDSTLNVNKLVGRINAADATIADGTVIGGKQGSLDLAGTSVSFDGDVTIDAAVNSYNSSDATTININEGANVVWNTKQYDLYHGGFNTDSGDTLNVLGNLTITGDNVYLKAATNVAEGGALNITDAGFQNTYGKLTVKGDMNITDTYEDGAYQNIKLAGNDNASTTGSLDVDGGTLTIDAPSFAFGGGFKSNGWVDVTSADVTVQNGGKITSNAVVFRNGANSTVTLDNGTFEFTAAPDFGTVHVTLGTQIDNNGTIIAKNGSTLDFGDRTFINAGTIDVSDSTFAAGTFDHQSTSHAIFNDVDMDVTNFKNGVKDAGAYAIIGGNSKVQIDNLSGDRLHFADGTVLKDGTSIKGSTSTRSLGNITFGETENDMIHVDSFANNGTSAYDGTITVNGTLSISDNGDDKLSPTYWLGIHGSESGTLLTSETGKGVINSSGLWNIFQYGKITVDEGVTINIADAYARDLRFTLTDITIKGEINSIGSNNKLNAIQTSTVTITGENAALNVDGYLLVGYSTYKYPNDTTDMYKSTVTVSDGASLNVEGNLYINKESSITIDASSTFSAGSIINDGGMINSTTAGEIVLNQDLTTGTIQTDKLTLNAGAALTVGTLTVTNLNLTIGSDLSVAGASSIGTITVLGELVPENAEFVLVSTGWANLGETTVMYKGTEYTVTDSVDGLTGLNFVTVGGNLYVKDFGAAISGIYIGELPENAQTGDKVTTADGATYTVEVDAFATAAAAADKVDVDAVKSITLGDGDHVNEVADNFGHISEITIHEGTRIEDTKAAEFDYDLVINNYGHLDSQITVGGELTITNTSVNTLLGSYSADSVITVNNAGGMIGEGTYGVEDPTEFNTVELTVNNGDAVNVKVNTGVLNLNDTNTFGLNANSKIFEGDAYGAGQINLYGSANMSINGDLTDTHVEILGNTDEHTGGTLTLNGKQTYSGDISANKIVVVDVDDKEVTFNLNTVDFNELNVAGTLNTDFTAMDSFNDAGEVTGTGTLNSTHAGTWIVNNSVTRDVTGFAGTVTMENAGAEIVLKNDKSYFSDDAKMVIKTGQTVTLAKDAAATGIDFSSDPSGAGTINVGAYDTAFADVSTGFTQTLSGSNDNFTGTVNVSEEAKLILQSGIGGSITLDAKADTGKATTLELGKDGLEVAATVTGDANDIINVAENAALTSDAALNNFAGTVAVNAKELTLGGVNETAAKFDGTGIIDANANQTLTAEGALDNFSGTVELEGDKLTLSDVNETSAKFDGTGIIDANANQTLKAAGALNNFSGTIELEGNTLTLKDVNTTSATLTGTTAVVDADADQTFSGDVSGFSGTYDIATQVTLGGTIAGTINAKGETLNLTNATVKTVTVNAADILKTLNFGGNTLTLGTGDFTNVIGNGGNITDFGEDQIFDTVTAGTIYVTGTDDALTIKDLTADINITIDGPQIDPNSDVTITNAFVGDVSVTIEDSDDLTTTPYKVATYSGFTTDTSISLKVESNAASTLKVDELVVIDNETYLLQLKDNTLILTKLPGYSNYVVVDGDWTNKTPYQSVDDNGTERIIGYNAAVDLDNAVSYIKGRPSGLDWGTNDGDAKIELTEGKYTLTTGTLMTDTNGVTQLTLQGRDGQVATLTGTIVGSNGSKGTTLTMNNVRVQGDLYAGGNLVIDNKADLRTTGNVIAAGVAEGDMANNSMLTIEGGYFGNRLLVGGSVNNSTEKMTVTGKTAVVIDNKYDEKLIISGNIVGGSWAAYGAVEQNADASITINVDKETQIRGNIFVNGGEGHGTLTMNGNSEITFSGDGSKLTFTSTVSAINCAIETIVFDNYTGAFNGTISGFDVISIKGDTSLTLGRRQTKTGDTALSFTVNVDTTDAAMYTVRDNDSWEFAKNISVTVDGTTNAGTYVLVDNYIGGFEGFTFTFNGVDYTLGNAVGGKVITVSDDQLVLTVAGNNTNLVGNTTGQIVIDSSAAGKETQIVGDVVDNATTNSSAAVKITADDAVISNTGTITGIAETQKSVAIEIQSGTSDAVVNNSGTITAADVAKYNRAIYSEGKDLAVSNSGTINGEIYQNTYGAQSLDVNNSGTITAMTSDMGSNSVISSSNGIINLTGDGGTYELAANTETGKFNGEIVEGQNGILVTANNTTFKAGTDVTVGNGTVKGLFNDSGMNIEIAGDGNTIQIVSKRSATGIEEFSYDLYKNNQSDVIISGDNNTISVTSASGATGIIGRNGAVVITGSGTEINVTSTGSYAYGIETKDVKDFSGDVIIGEFNADGSVAQASDIQITVDGQVSTNSNPVMSPIGIYAKKGTAQIALAEDGKIDCGSFTAVSAEKVQITNAGTIIGDVVATGSATDDALSMDIDAILNGSMSGVENLAVTGVSALATDVAGAKTIVGGVDDVLASASIDGVAADLNGTAVQVAADVWASLTKNTDNSLTVAWGRDAAEVGAALDAFKADSTLTLGDSMVASAATLDDADAANDFSKKSRGTLA